MKSTPSEADAVLKRRGVPTQLVVYPGEGRSLSVPSYERDLYERYLAWLAQYPGDEAGPWFPGRLSVPAESRVTVSAVGGAGGSRRPVDCR